jgi:subtilase family serine protease
VQWVWGHQANTFPWEGTGSGCSIFEGANYWQIQDVQWGATGCFNYAGSSPTNNRAVSDISADGDPFTGEAIYYTPPKGTTSPFTAAGWHTLGGTSLASPLIAGMVALAGGTPANQIAQQNLYDNYKYQTSVNSGADPDLTDITSTALNPEINSSCPTSINVNNQPTPTSCTQYGTNWAYEVPNPASPGTYMPNPNWGGSVSCPMPYANSSALWIMCDGAQGYDGPTGLGTPYGLGAFNPSPPPLPSP